MRRRNCICSFVLTVLLAATAQADQTEELGVQYARGLTRVVNEVEQQQVDRITQRQLRELEKKLDELLKEMRQLRRELNRPSRQIEAQPPQRERDARADADESRSGTPEVDQRYLKYSGFVIKKYDENGDEVLVSNEWSKMSKDPSAADTNHDGRISALELALFYQQPRESSTQPSQEHAARQPQADPRYLKYSTAYIKKYDDNGDGVLTENEWSKMPVDYSDADTNYDGKITPTEMALLLMKRSGAGGS
jgi:TolA-binding protein